MSKDLHAKKKCESSCDSVNVYIPPLVIYIYTVYFKVTGLDLSYHIPSFVRIYVFSVCTVHTCHMPICTQHR